LSDDSSSSPVVEGDLIAGKYRVQRTLGAGGMGVVVAAVHVELNQRVALKFLLPQAAGDRDFVERFAREARAAAQIQSEHVARVMDVGTLETGAPYMVMEYLEGEDLQQQLANRGPLPVATAVEHVLHACEAIAEAHAIGIVHRDLKPANIFLASRPNGSVVVKVLDFGISKSTMTTDQSDLTKGSTMVGSPSYMSPEQIKAARAVDVRADQWSLGVILYELIAGAKPFRAGTMAELIWVILDQPHAPLRSLCPDVPPGLDAAINRCLTKDPAGRFASVAELASAIAPYGPEGSAASARRTAHVLGVATSSASAPVPAAVLDALAPTRSSGEASGAAAGGVTSPPWSQSYPSAGKPGVAAAEKPRSSVIVPVAIGVLAAAGLVGAVMLMQLSGGPTSTAVPPVGALSAAARATPSATPPSSSAPGSAAPAAETATPGSPVAAPPPTHAASEPQAPVTPPPEAPREAVHAKGGPPPATKAAAAPPASAAGVAPKCATVTYFDSDGMKHFRQECR